jgi:hypothetical protein
MNTDQEGMDTDGRACFAIQLSHPWASVFIIFKLGGLAAVALFAARAQADGVSST